jgi:hypothetical protein
MVFQHQKEVKSDKQWCFSIGRKSIVLNSGVSASGKIVKRREKAKQLLDGVVSSMKMVRKWQTGVFWEWEE